MRHGLRAEHFFTSEEKKRIHTTVSEVESRTIGEVATMVVESSDHYFEAEMLGGILLGGIVSLMITAVFFQSSVWSYIPLMFLFFFPSRLLFKRFHALKSVLISHHRKEHAVRLRAVRAFYEKGLYKTRHQTGVLFLISLLERKVRVLADSGIHEKIGQETLDKFARNISRGIRDGHACTALCETIQEAGALLAHHFPKTPDDTNELPDTVMSG